MTGDGYLEETNTWGDTYWGYTNGRGRNFLGRLIARIRDTPLDLLKKEADRLEPDREAWARRLIELS